MKNKKLLSFVLAVMLTMLTGCQKASPKPSTYTGTAFDTVIAISVYDPIDEKIYQTCESMCNEFENKFSRTKEGSELYQINHAGGKPVEVSDDTISLLKTSLKYSRLSEGAFDPTIGAVSSLWDFKSDHPQVPDPDKIAEALTHVDYRNVSINGNFVTLNDPEAILDLGAIAKGYIADRLKEYLVSQGIRHATINLGGNIQTIGGKPDGSAFHLGIQEPFSDTGQPATAVDIKNLSLVTSGTYERCFEVDGQFYHHILDPKTGYPSDSPLNSVTILAANSVDADALSTTCFLLGPEKGMQLVQNLDHVEILFMDKNNTTTYSPKFFQ